MSLRPDDVKRRENIYWIALVSIANPRPWTNAKAIAKNALELAQEKPSE